MPGKKGRVLALLLALLAVAFRARAAQDTKDVDVTESHVHRVRFHDISSHPLTEAPSCQPPATKHRSRRFSSRLHPDVLARGPGTNFTAIFKFPARDNAKIGIFSARPRSLLAQDNAWYYTLEINGTAMVYAALQLPECEGIDCRPEAIIDIVCDHCDAQRAILQYGPARQQWKSIQKAANLKAFQRRSPTSLKKKLTVVKKETCKIAGLQCWDFTTTAKAMCNGAFDAAIAFEMKPGKSEETYHWRVGNNMLYEAKVGALGRWRVIQLKPNDRWSLCKTPTDKITLQIACKSCSVVRNSAVLEKPKKPEVPQNAVLMPVAHLTSSYRAKEGNCDISAVRRPWAETPTGENYVIQAWYYPGHAKCAKQESGSDRAATASDWLENHKRLAQFEETMNKTVSALSWSFDMTTQCLCSQVRGVVYRVLDWVADNQRAIRNGSPNTCLGVVNGENTDMVRSVMPSASDIYTTSTTAELKVTSWTTSKPEVIPSPTPEQENTSTTLELETPSASSTTPEPRVTSSKQVSYSSTLYPMLLPRWTDCRGCRKYKPNVDPEKVFELINPQPLTLVNDSTITDEKGRTVWRLRSEVPESVLDFGFNFKFTGLFKFPSSNGEKGYEFAVRPITFLSEDGAWNIDGGMKGTRWVYAELQVPFEIPPDSPMNLDINVVCDNCDLQKAQVFYLPQREDWRSISKRATWDVFWNRSPEAVDIPVHVAEKTACTLPENRCFEFNTTALALCSTAFDGGLTFHVVPGNSSESYYWVVGTDSKRYAAEVGVIGWMRTVQWYSEDRWDFCKSPTETISLQMMCEDCSISPSGVVAYRPTGPAIPFDVIPTPLVNLRQAEWKEKEGICVIEAVSEQGEVASGATNKDDTLRLWLTPKPTECVEPEDRSDAEFALGQLKEREDVAAWEREVAKDLTRSTWELSCSSRCLCTRVRGGIYRIVAGGTTSDDYEISEEETASTSDSDVGLDTI